MVAPTYLKSFQALELALRVGSLKGAADVLSITPAAVGQRVKTLEDYLGVDLLVRGRSGLTPSPALQAAADHLGAAFRELQTVADMLELQRGQEIHIAAASDFADLWLRPRLKAFRAAHPNTLFCINGEGEAPLRLGPMDCEITFGARRDGAEIDPLFGDYVLPVTSAENTERVSHLPFRERLEGFPLLHLDFYKDDPAAPDWAEWVEANALHRTAPNRGMRFQRIGPVLEAVQVHAGVAICGLALVSELIEDGRLSLPFPTATGAWTDHLFQARFRPDALTRPQIRHFRTWLLEEAQATGAWLDAMAGRIAAEPA